ncbi:MAG TPA: outer membrane beta-barrel protein [Tenuifilaceae bacterium]|nr:outer membrane beta-barrel protein [Tenuifilaceae bacterium]HPE16991.1 outer membrane beta-barrel protein [Tenuifilaceae bacterium]HPJ44723.1 outer membrane beta-barrel protein [Tenuifilaceae bacterium]HPQ32988.1 outer membrane beta-barrel protein [Tenuifilaceae bacterium]HRX66806.1 outer membrane beta-barrel protein [Tenuifilaceae bacterium]
MKLLKTQLVILMLFCICFVFLNNKAYAQFEQKITLQGSLGYVSAINPSWFSEHYPSGASIDLGIQYNFSRSFSVAVLAQYGNFWGLYNEEDEPDHYMEEMADYYQLGINLAPKFRFLPGKRFNPYVLGGANISFISFDYTYYYIDYETNEIEDVYEEEVIPVTFGFMGGVGFDYRLTDNFSLFLQSGVNTVWDNDEDYPEFLTSFYTQVGVNISLFKSKSL